MKIGPFEILETIGGGGSGIVYKARHDTLGRVVALKQLNRQVHEGDAAWSRFAREAAVMASIRSEHVVTLYSFQVLDGRPVLEMEFLEHGSLEDVMRGGPVAQPTALRAIEDVLLGLHAIHQAGIVHRDVKPGNILQDASGRYKLADFGISVVESGAKATLGAATIRYVAPESIADTPTWDARSDLYSVGMVAYEMLLGNEGLREAFPDLMPAAAFAAKWFRWLKERGREATPLHVIRRDIPVPVSSFVARLAAKDPDLRYSSADAALEALRSLVVERAGAAAPAPSARAQRETPSPPAEPVVKDTGAMAAWELVVDVVRGGDHPTRLSFSHTPVVIGSSPQSDVVLADPYVSAEHATLVVSRGQVMLHDRSRNGTYVAGAAVKSLSLGRSAEVSIPPYRLAVELRVPQDRPGTLAGVGAGSSGSHRAQAPSPVDEAGTIFISGAVATGPARLRVVKAPAELAGAQFDVTGPSVMVGRSPRARIRLNHPTVSRRHLEIQQRPNDVWMVVDLGSANGMAVNGRRVSQHVLVPGDRISVGPEIELEFSIVSQRG